jgi:hypothetical protein
LRFPAIDSVRQSGWFQSGIRMAENGLPKIRETVNSVIDIMLSLVVRNGGHGKASKTVQTMQLMVYGHGKVFVILSVGWQANKTVSRDERGPIFVVVHWTNHY